MKTLILLLLLAVPASGVDLVIKAVDATHPDPVKDARGCYKRGDIVAVVRDGAEVGRLVELPPKDGGKFVRIRVCKNDGSELLPSELLNIIKAKWTNFVDVAQSEYSITNAEQVVRRRALQVPIDLFTTVQKTTLNNTGTLGFTNTGQAAITLSAARTRIVNKLTGETP